MAKKDVYTSPRCMASGILIGRLAAGLSAFERALEGGTSWSPGYAVGRALRPARSASKQLERALPASRPHTKKLTEILGRWSDVNSFGFDREKAAVAAKEIRERLEKVALVAVEACGKRRPVPEEADALLKLKSAPRRPAPEKVVESQAPPQELVESQELVVVEKLEGGSSSSDTPWAIIAGVCLVIGATYWVGRASA